MVKLKTALKGSILYDPLVLYNLNCTTIPCVVQLHISFLEFACINKKQ